VARNARTTRAFRVMVGVGAKGLLRGERTVAAQTDRVAGYGRQGRKVKRLICRMWVVASGAFQRTTTPAE
jgi:hypothetical protein